MSCGERDRRHDSVCAVMTCHASPALTLVRTSYAHACAGRQPQCRQIGRIWGINRPLCDRLQLPWYHGGGDLRQRTACGWRGAPDRYAWCLQLDSLVAGRTRHARHPAQRARRRRDPGSRYEESEPRPGHRIGAGRIRLARDDVPEHGRRGPGARDRSGQRGAGGALGTAGGQHCCYATRRRRSAATRSARGTGRPARCRLRQRG